MESKVVIFVLLVIFSYCHYGVLEVLILILFLCRPSPSTTSTTLVSILSTRVIPVCFVVPRPSCRGCLWCVAGQLYRRDMLSLWCCYRPAMPAGHLYFVKFLCKYPVRPLRLPERRLTFVPANSGTPYVLFLAKIMPNFFAKFSMTLLKIGHMVYCGRGILVLT